MVPRFPCRGIRVNLDFLRKSTHETKQFIRDFTVFLHDHGFDREQITQIVNFALNESRKDYPADWKETSFTFDEDGVAFTKPKR